jgi:hypothetical protein
MNRRLLFSSSKKDSEHNREQQNKFEVLTCNVLSESCKKHLVVINECYIEANKYHLEKDYLNTIESLKNAFFRTNQLNENSCLKCANLFRSTITESIENIHGELQNLTTGLFRKKCYQKSFIASCDVLNEIKNC